MNGQKFERVKRVNKGLENRCNRNISNLELQRRRYVRKWIINQENLKLDYKMLKEEKFQFLVEKKTSQLSSFENEDDMESDSAGILGTLLPTSGLLHGTGIHGRYDRTAKLAKPQCPDSCKDFKNKMEVNGNNEFAMNEDSDHEEIILTPQNGEAPTNGSISKLSDSSEENTTIQPTEQHATNTNNEPLISLPTREEENKNPINGTQSSTFSPPFTMTTIHPIGNMLPNFMLGQQTILRRRSEPKRSLASKRCSFSGTQLPSTRLATAPTSGLARGRHGHSQEEIIRDEAGKAPRPTSASFQLRIVANTHTSYNSGRFKSSSGEKVKERDEGQRDKSNEKFSRHNIGHRSMTAPGRYRMSVIKKQIHNHEKNYTMELRKKRQSIENENVIIKVWAFIGRRPLSAPSYMSTLPKIQSTAMTETDEINPDEERALKRKFAALARRRHRR